MRASFYNLRRVAKTDVLFGHQDATRRGVDGAGGQWANEQHLTAVSREQSDVKTITGAHLAVYGHDFLHSANYEHGNWFDHERDIARQLTIDAYVDLVGVNNYWDLRVGQASTLACFKLKIVMDYAQKKNKLAALTKTGLDNLTQADWYTNQLLMGLQCQPMPVSCVIVWANTRDHFWTPFEGHAAENDVKHFKQNAYLLFGKEMPKMYEIR